MIHNISRVLGGGALVRLNVVYTWVYTVWEAYIPEYKRSLCVSVISVVLKRCPPSCSPVGSGGAAQSCRVPPNTADCPRLPPSAPVSPPPLALSVAAEKLPPLAESHNGPEVTAHDFPKHCHQNGSYLC